MFGRGPGNSLPDLLKPFLVIVRRYEAQNLRRNIRCAVSTWLSLHQNEFNVVLNHGVGLIRFPQEARTVFDFIRCIRDFMPDDRRQVVEANPPTMFLYRRMKRNYRVAPTVLAA